MIRVCDCNSIYNNRRCLGLSGFRCLPSHVTDCPRQEASVVDILVCVHRVRFSSGGCSGGHCSIFHVSGNFIVCFRESMVLVFVLKNSGEQTQLMISPPSYYDPITNWFLASVTLAPRPFRLPINLMASFCTNSIFCAVVLVDGSHTVSANSRIGLHRLVYASSLASFGALYIRCLMLPRIFHIFF